MKDKTQTISNIDFTINTVDSKKFTINISDCKEFTVNISDCKNYILNQVDCTKSVVTTNADRIRAMSDEELAMNMMCPNENGLAEIECNRDDSCKCYECLLNWLKSKVEEQTNEGR